VEIAQVPQGQGGWATSNSFEAVRYVSEPTLSRTLRSHEVRMVAPVHEIQPGQQAGVILFGRRLLKDDPDLGHRFMRAYLRAVRQYNQGKTDRNVEIISRGTKLPPQVIREACWEPIRPDGHVAPEGLTAFLDWSLQHGYLEKPVEPALWWNPSYVDAANRALGPAPSGP
jgi:NitT/TauT family transport system substrate-binding protein